MQYPTENEESIRAAMIDEALALLGMLESEQDDEDINERPLDRRARLTMQAMARQLVAKMIAELQVPEPLPGDFRAAA